jgi:protoporphyrinogen oxidase
MYVEVSSRPGIKKDPDIIMKKSIEGLKRCGILKKRDHIIVKNYLDIEHAYVIFDRRHRNNVPEIIKYLRKNRVYSAGRYGSWTYSSMEDSLIQGGEIAKALK